VHAFAQSSIGYYFVTYIVVAGAACAWLVFSRLDYLKSDNELDSMMSRESSFLFNNLVFLGACFAVLWGTIFPVISEAIQGEKVSVGAPFFNKINIPVGLFLLFLTGVGPLLAWRKTSVRSLQRNFLWPTVGAAVFTGVVIAFGVRGFYALVSIYLCVFVTWTIFAEFYRGIRARMRAHGERIDEALLRLIGKNKRRYGGYIVHFAMVLIFVGFTGNAFNKEAQAEIAVGESMSIGSYTLTCTEVIDGSTPNYSWMKARLDISKNGRAMGSLEPEKRFYMASEQPTSEVALRSSLIEDLYVVFAGVSDDRQHIVMQVFLNPLVVWVWIGSIVFALGTIVAILPDGREVKMRRRKRNLERVLTTSETL